MLRFLNIILVAGVLGSAFALYSLEHQTRSLEREIAGTKAKIADEYELIGLLNTEWSLLVRPQRLEQLAKVHLHMGPVMPDQIISQHQITGSLPPAPVHAPDKTPQNNDPLADLLRMMQ